MLAQLRPAIVLMLLFTLLLGLAYPLAITGIGQAAFPAQANGSRIERDGVLIGSSLIGQNFAGAGYFHPRPSAADYNAASSGASNLGPTSMALRNAIVERSAALALDMPVPADAVTTSGSGLDPHISPAFARTQVARIATARALPPEQVAALLAATIEHPVLGLIGEPQVNVLRLNLALDAMAPPAS
ncbi:hypothetical protein VW29_17365 [Devosia limi DSM 17137]|uniref:Potassium-transporting ATPase KdpC subunit n=1 Tax=Devosia limi DSM 17137 TaxID=1121477 RepID=A0A0F5LAW7_9HYPH|nr:potassium-transporting ATPase subunit KdpC [Devosia limi]KKB79339.1 hypothetical protein VW29_17365 [Devosia limi DSM 17137]SHF29911.1 K+-transporting ATPase ATPase C chain [Devosia limi DSM 17137]